MRLAMRFLVTCAPLVGAQVASAQFVVRDHVAGGILGFDDAAITPDGSLVVLRDNTVSTSARVYDLATGDLLAVVFPSVPGHFSGVAQDAVVCTDERAVVIGSRLMVLDLTQLTTPLLADHDVGYRPRDLALTPDGTTVVVRGGSSLGGFAGGLYVFDVASGAQLAYAAGEPAEYAGTAFDVDSVVADDEHAVCTSFLSAPQGDMTRVTIFDLHPAGGGAPLVVYETTAANDQLGMPHDLAMTPDGTHAAVRSELGVALYRLDGASSTQVWRKRLYGDPGSFGGSAMDSIEASDEYVATISRWSNGGIGAQIDLFDIAGHRHYDRVDGDPHDLAITPDGTRLLVRTHLQVLLYDLANVPSGTIKVMPSDWAPQTSSHTSWGAGLDSIAAGDTCAVSIARTGATTDIRQWELGASTFDLVKGYTMPDEPTDLALTPDLEQAVVSGLGHALVIDLRARQITHSHSPTSGTVWPWCDGVVADGEHMVAFGYIAGNHAGWVSLIDLFAQPVSYCTANPNSTGAPSTIFATGSASVSANDLALWASGLPQGRNGAFLYGSAMDSTPFGDGVLCVGGSSFRFPPILHGGELAHQPVDFTLLTGAGAILPGSTWHFQYLHRDTIGAGFNLSDALAIDFGG